jgi:hypothetical protein
MAGGIVLASLAVLVACVVMLLACVSRKKPKTPPPLDPDSLLLKRESRRKVRPDQLALRKNVWEFGGYLCAALTKQDLSWP